VFACSRVMMLDFSSDGEPNAMWTTDLNGAGKERMVLTLGALELSVAQPGTEASQAIGTGALVWQAGPALASVLMKSRGGCVRDQLDMGRTLEIGCGCSALPGVALALLGAAEVLVSDSAAILDELRPNLEGYFAANDESTMGEGCSTPRCTICDVITAKPLRWDDPDALDTLARDEAGRSLVVAADCDYADSLHGMLLDTVSAALSPTTTSVALFATAARCQRTLRLFLSRLDACSFEVIELTENLEPLQTETSPAVRQDGVRFFAARWRSIDDAKSARAKFILGSK